MTCGCGFAFREGSLRRRCTRRTNRTADPDGRRQPFRRAKKGFDLRRRRAPWRPPPSPRWIGPSGPPPLPSPPRATPASQGAAAAQAIGVHLQHARRRRLVRPPPHEFPMSSDPSQDLDYEHIAWAGVPATPPGSDRRQLRAVGSLRLEPGGLHHVRGLLPLTSRRQVGGTLDTRSRSSSQSRLSAPSICAVHFNNVQRACYDRPHPLNVVSQPP